MAASTWSSPAWRGMWRWRQTLGSSRTRATSAGVTCTGRTLEMRRRSRPSIAVSRSTRGARAARSPRPSAYLPGGVAVVAQVDAGEHALADAPGDLAADVVDDLGLRVGAQRPAGPGDDAEGAPLVAAGLGLDGHPGAQ